ncbi:MAG: DNRLRE domain-containing protein [Armatimonadetes bacterium]|nr:DNRLRE domain-containing protein [Armatimonadota bacterium]
MKSALGCLTLVLVSAVALADQTTLSAVSDARILSFQPTSSDGLSSTLSTYNDNASNIQRTLIQFDYSTLAGATINSAILRLYGSSFGHPAFQTTTSVYRPTQAWTESQVTWDSAKTGTNWSTPGGDYVGSTGIQNASPYASVTQTEVDGHWYEFDLTTLVANQASGSLSNFGFVLTGSTGNSLIFNSRENTQGFSPQLVVTYSPVPEPGTFLALGVSVLALVCRKRR